MLLSFRLLSRYGPHLYIHSFPTRRSSDLGGGILAPPGFGRAAPGGGTTRRCGRGCGERPRSPHPLPNRRVVPRSEEHTSELQSLRHLVCRLLLEKKKN